MAEALEPRRQKVRVLIQERTGLDETHSADLEIGIYNWTIDFCDAKKVFKNWKNNRFAMLYAEKARSVISNIDPQSYLKNDDLLQRMNDKKFLPHEVPFMKPDEMSPDRWRDVTEAFFKKMEHAYETKQEAMTSEFKCSKCKGRKCTYYTAQLRSADEPETIFVRCIDCGHGWKIG